ncbi:hypothetical protein B0T19DRAFT_433240 [Cercophora scortea]|uniref:Protein kinase domain-containing protein n=1 Tax=Cercophora scortea TaxID=314031 RepID=A0AAE0I8Y1_9PEZI|nr:hypothetical protein B0T19DRAFT_433240 [Cercophora scortea]
MKNRSEELESFRRYLVHLVLIGPIRVCLLLRGCDLDLSESGQRMSDKERTWMLLRSYFFDDARLSPIQQRLIRANLVRRNRFNTYRRKLEKLSSKQAARPNPNEPRAAGVARDPAIEPTRLGRESAPSAVARKTSTLSQIPQSTTRSLRASEPATEISPSFVAPTQAGRQVATKSVTSGVSQGVMKHDYPKCPVKNEDFWCPCCAQPLNSAYSDPKKTIKWRGHVAEDLAPYVCIYGDCNDPDTMYVTSEEWKKHLEGSHGVPCWICDPCWLESTDREEFEFDREKDWRLHMQSEHAAELDEGDLPDLAEASQRTAIQRVACPLCHDPAPPLHPLLDKHIAEHLHSFALQALPWEPFGPSDDIRSSDAGSGVNAGPFPLSESEEDHETTESSGDRFTKIREDTESRLRYGELVSSIIELGPKLAERLPDVDLGDRLADIFHAIDDITTNLPTLQSTPGKVTEISSNLADWVTRLTALVGNHLDSADHVSLSVPSQEIVQGMEALQELLVAAIRTPAPSQSSRSMSDNSSDSESDALSEHSFVSLEIVTDHGFDRQKRANSPQLDSTELSQRQARQNRIRSGSDASSAYSDEEERGVTDYGFDRHKRANSPLLGSTQARRTRVRSGSDASSAHSDEEEQAVTGTNIGKLARRLRDGYIRSKASDKEFLPIDSLEALLTPQIVREVLTTTNAATRFLSARPMPELDQLTQSICESRQKLFAILVLCDKVGCIGCLVECGISDSDLPLQLNRSPLTHDFALHVRTDRNHDRPLGCFNKDEWSDMHMEWFVTSQYVVLSPFFDFRAGEVLFYKLDADVVLPFIELEFAGEGGQASVGKVRIHPAHHNAPDPKPQFFAVKRAHSHKRDDYDKEVDVLLRLSGSNRGHPHLNRLLLTFQHGGNFQMVFNWADGNLREFWKQLENIEPEGTQDLACWLMMQCHGIADGLREIQSKIGADSLVKSTGPHADIKPDNILWLKSYRGRKNHLLISDFGLSQFRSGNLEFADRPLSCSPSYGPPECELGHEGTCARHEIWKLGCLFLDFLTWYLLGFHAVDVEFVDKRVDDDKRNGADVAGDSFFMSYYDGATKMRMAKLKPSVVEWIKKLHNLEHCPGFAHDVLHIIENRLLQPDNKARWRCTRVVNELDRIRRGCEEDGWYCVAGFKWTPNTAAASGKRRKAQSSGAKRERGRESLKKSFSLSGTK